MVPAALLDTLEAQLGARVLRRESLAGGCVSPVYRVGLDDGRDVVLKLAPPQAATTEDGGSSLILEALMLDTLAGEGWPTPGVLLSSQECLVLEHVAHDGRCGTAGEEAAGELLARLHDRPQPCFGLTRDTAIAGLPQANPRSAHWVPFFSEHRLLAMALAAEEAGRLEATDRRRVERLAGTCDRWLREPDHPSLIHGDLWGGNILFHDGAVAAVIDPACYWGHAEVELAFTTLFGTFGDAFFRVYEGHRPLEPGFFEERRDLYNLYPLLVHLRLFGGHYRDSVRQTLTRYGV